MVDQTELQFTEIPENWKGESHLVGTKSTQDKIIRKSLIAGAFGVQQGRQAAYFSAAHPFSEHFFPIEDSVEPQVVPCHHKKL